MSRKNSPQRGATPYSLSISHADVFQGSREDMQRIAANAKEYWSNEPVAETGTIMPVRGRSDSVSTTSTTSTIRSFSRQASPHGPKPEVAQLMDNYLVDVSESTAAVDSSSPGIFRSDMSLSSPPLTPQSAQSVKDRLQQLRIPFSPRAIYSQALGLELTNILPSIATKVGWAKPKQVEHCNWAWRNPRSAMLFLWICNDFAAWPGLVVKGISDAQLPFQIAQLDGIVSKPSLALQVQWRVMVVEMSRDGKHFTLSPNSCAPFEQLETLRLESNGQSRLDRVRWIDSTNARGVGDVVVRKVITTRSESQAKAVIASIKAYTKFNLDNAAKILVSYSQAPSISIITPLAEASLSDVLRSVAPAADPSVALSWIYQLALALSQLHTRLERHHGSIRPCKVLLTNSRACFSVFGVPSTASQPVLGQLNERYIYAAPEQIPSSHGQATRPADVFSLGCVLIDIVTIALGIPSHQFEVHRSAVRASAGGRPVLPENPEDTQSGFPSRSDPSFHANLDRVRSWLQILLRHVSTNGGPVSGLETRGFMKLIEVLEKMVAREPSRRPVMQKVLRKVGSWEDERAKALQSSRSFSINSVSMSNISTTAGEMAEDDAWEKGPDGGWRRRRGSTW